MNCCITMRKVQLIAFASLNKPLNSLLKWNQYTKDGYAVFQDPAKLLISTSVEYTVPLSKGEST